MTRNRQNIWPTLLLSSILLGVGGTAGFFLRPVILPVAIAPGTGDEAEANAAIDPSHEGSSVVEILSTTMENMRLNSGKFQVRDYHQNIRIPARVVERIPQSRRRVSAPIGGRVTKVLIAEGQAIRPGEKLFEFRITDESLADSQIGLLSVISQIDVNQQKLDRLKPLVASGVVANKRILEVEFEISSLDRQRDVLKQELSLKGMDEKKMRDLIDNKKLMQTIEIFAPVMTDFGQRDAVQAENNSQVQQVSLNTETRPGSNSAVIEARDDDQYYTVESISALEGTNQATGASLCELTHHGELLIEGQAFESDIEEISKANESGWRFTAQFGEGEDAQIRENLKLFKIENHVDDQSQTYPIFVELENEIIGRTTDQKNRTYVNWRFKPGQRAHLEFPIDVWKQQVVAPLPRWSGKARKHSYFKKSATRMKALMGRYMSFKKSRSKSFTPTNFMPCLPRTCGWMCMKSTHWIKPTN